MDRIFSEVSQHSDVLILGSSITALMTASFLQQENPGFDVTVVGPRPDEEKRPLVGESLIEPSTLLFYKMGLGKYLEREHYLKNSLTYYHKLRPEDAADRRYSVHATDGLIHLSRQLHRPRFDRHLRDHAESLGVRFLDGKAVSYKGRSKPDEMSLRHEVGVKTEERTLTLCSHWIIDATGRNRWLGKQLTTYDRPSEMQRSSLWFHLADFEPFLGKIDATQRRPLSYNKWEVTHHFMGHGNWVWGIPLKSPDHDQLMSMGITYRPDLFPHPMKTIDDFLTFMDGEHPVVSEMIRTGNVLDTNVLNNYLYRADQVYSPQGWFLLGDAAHAVDPLYSTGLTLTVFQIEQVNAIIQGQKARTMSSGDVRALESLWLSFAKQRGKEVGQQYEVMHDPFQASMRRYWDTHTYFEVVLPSWWSGLFCDPKAARVLRRLFGLNTIATAASKLLFSQVSQRLGKNISQSDFNRTTDLMDLVNPEFDCASDLIPGKFADLFKKRVRFREDLMRMAGRHRTLAQLPVIALESLLSHIVPLFLRSTGICVNKEPFMKPERLPIELESMDHQSAA